METEKERQKSDLAQMEEKILDFWRENHIFKKTEEKNAPLGDFVFFEGPPTANGKPGIHHVEARSFKDVIPRYKTMKGFKVVRRAGWDTHGLPVELQVEKELGLKSKKEIEEFGVAEFNKKCKASVLQYIDLWKKFTERIGYWVDLEKAYFTFDNSYIESVWNIVKTVNDKNLLYKDYKVVPWCPRCGTALSSHELAQGYEDVKDLSVYASFKILNPEAIELPSESYIVAWTTTPWTLPGNVALAVGENISYGVYEKEGKNYIVALELSEKLGFTKEELRKEYKGENLLTLSYEPLYPFLKDEIIKNGEDISKAFKVYPADFVTTTDGTGIVHTAVMYGADDFVLGSKIGLPKKHTVRNDGTFYEWCGFLANRFVKDEEVAVDVIKDLAGRGLLFKKEKYEHSYPHCWRCKTPLIYFARDSWYIGVSTLRDTLVNENKTIGWEPEYIREGRFGEWLRDIKDWAISRERYWGTPLPVWESENGEERFVPSSIEELKSFTKKSGNRYIIMRHAEAEHNIKGILSSDTEEAHALTAKGKEEAKNAGAKLLSENIDLIISSPLQRTRETAEIVAAALDKKVFIDERIREEDFGDISGFKASDFTKYFPNFEFRLNESVGGGETLRETKKRMGEFLYDLEKTYEGKTILIVTHDGPAKLLKVVAAGADDKETEVIYTPGVNYLPYAGFETLSFVPLPHDDDFKLDLHKPYIDEITLVSKKGTALKRVKEVMDVWFDSGAMPFAQNHYPFENKNEIDTGKSFPADFISEAIDQTRGWFYTLHAVSNLLGKGKAYKNVICLGHLLDKDGKKMSKSLGNVIDPWEMADKYGVDTLRLWLYSVNQPGESKNFDERTVDEVRKKFFNILSNVYVFYEQSKGESAPIHDRSTRSLDVWILSRLSLLEKKVSEHMDKFQILEPVREMRLFIDDLSTWYLRRSREALREGNKDAVATLGFVLQNFAKILAPFAPFFAEDLYQKIEAEDKAESVHLAGWPKLMEYNETIISDMVEVRRLASLALQERNKENIKVKQPLQSIKIGKDLENELKEILKDEINVKEVIVESALQEKIELDFTLTESLILEGAGRELIRFIQDMRKEAGFIQEQKITLTLSSNDAGKKLLSEASLMEDVSRVVGAFETKYTSTNGKTLQLGDMEFTVSVAPYGA